MKLSEEVQKADRRVQVLIRGIAETRFKLIEALAEIRRRQHFEKLGFQSFEAYLSDRCDRTLRWFEQHIRALKAFKDLPRLQKAVDEGRINPSHVIQMVPVLTPENEKEWIAKAEKMSWRELSEELRTAKDIAGQEPRMPQEALKRIPGWWMFLSDYVLWEDACKQARRQVGEKAHPSKVFCCIAEAALSQFIDTFPETATEGILRGDEVDFESDEKS